MRQARRRRPGAQSALVPLTTKRGTGPHLAHLSLPDSDEPSAPPQVVASQAHAFNPQGSNALGRSWGQWTNAMEKYFCLDLSTPPQRWPLASTSTQARPALPTRSLQSGQAQYVRHPELPQTGLATNLHRRTGGLATLRYAAVAALSLSLLQFLGRFRGRRGQHVAAAVRDWLPLQDGTHPTAAMWPARSSPALCFMPLPAYAGTDRARVGDKDLHHDSLDGTSLD